MSLNPVTSTYATTTMQLQEAQIRNSKPQRHLKMRFVKLQKTLKVAVVAFSNLFQKLPFYIQSKFQFKCENWLLQFLTLDLNGSLNIFRNKGRGGFSNFEITFLHRPAEFLNQQFFK